MNLYFDNAATSHPKPASVIRAVESALTDFNANPGRSGHAAALKAARQVLATREAIARFLGAEDPMAIVHTFNCTDGLNLAIKGILRRGDHVICTQLEHNSVLRVVNTLNHFQRIRLTVIPPETDGFVSPQRIRKAIEKDTRLIICTHASNVTGAIQPVAAIGEIARKYGVYYLIDGAQALGSLPVNVQALKCDLYAFPGHKSLLGPQGTGGLYIRPGVRLNPLREGGTGSSSDRMLQPEELPERYESGTVNLPGIAGLEAGIAHVQPRLDQIMIHERELTSALFEALSAIDGVQLYAPREEAARTGIISFNLRDYTSSQVADRLATQNIAVRGGLHCAPGAHQFLGTLNRGAVRASVGYANTFEEVDAFIRAIHNL